MIHTVKGFCAVTEAEVDVFVVFPLQVKEEKSYTSFNKCINSDTECQCKQEILTYLF